MQPKNRRNRGIGGKQAIPRRGARMGQFATRPGVQYLTRQCYSTPTFSGECLIAYSSRVTNPLLMAVAAAAARPTTPSLLQTRCK